MPPVLIAQSHRRYNPLRGEWVQVSPNRTARPWQGQVESADDPVVPAHDPSCYLCPGSTRAGGAVNPQYTSTFVFDNDYPAMTPDTPPVEQRDGDLMVARGEPGLCRVVCFSPRHDLTLSRMKTADIRTVVDVWAEESAALGARREIAQSTDPVYLGVLYRAEGEASFEEHIQSAHSGTEADAPRVMESILERYT